MAKPFDSIEASIKALKQSPDIIHIKSLRFPNYRNLQKDAKLPFEFPITVLLGRNGCNKSSVLHAIYGCQARNSISDFWFETDVDAIPESVEGRKQSVTHTYVLDGREVECIKARAPRGKADPDYWEAVKPTRTYGFPQKAERIPPITTEIIHLDFRGELPAFDKYFYFPDPSHLAQRNQYAKQKKVLRRAYKKQDYLRQRSRRLRTMLDSEGISISEQALDALKFILERDYESGVLLRHSLFHGHEGWTIVFRTASLSKGYSDAFAGSGESAVALLVHNILNAKSNSIILLDEPETSLHPRAQTRLMQFIAHYAVRKKLQFVMATHSIHLVEDLPQFAIRVLERSANGSVMISTAYTAREALHEIGDVSYGTTVIVEDDRAQHLVLSELQSGSSKASCEVRVSVREGGTSRIFRDIQAYANSSRKDIVVVFDGDHKPVEPMPTKGGLPRGQKELDKIINMLTKGPNRNGPDLDFVDIDERIRFIEYYIDYVRFLPGRNPEALVWSEARVLSVFEELGLKRLPESVANESDTKTQIRKIAASFPGMDESGVFQLLVAKFLREDAVERSELRSLVDFIRNLSS